MKNMFGDGEMPLGFGMALTKDLGALNRFSAMSPQERKRIMDGSRSVRSKEEMEEYVSNI